MLRTIHHLLTRSSVTRRHQRRFTRRLKNILGCPDAYGDIFSLCTQKQPAAFLDIGAHLGETVVRLTDELDHLPIHAFEPTPETVEGLRATAAKLPNVTVHPLAVSDETGTLEFFLNANEQTNSLLDNDEGSHQSFGKDMRHVARIEVDSVRLDDWAAKHVPQGLLAIKADIQGAESRLLNGGQRTFSERVMLFYSEVSIAHLYRGQINLGDLQERMSNEFGFSLYDIYPCLKDRQGRAVSTDAMWVRLDLLES